MSSFLRSPPPGEKASVNIDAENPHRRVILLLDMDCFYAQCEVVRLGVDRSVPLALMQWNSALAVNYPARVFGIKRGDSYDAVQEKSKGKCVAIHLPVTPVDENNSTDAKAYKGNYGNAEDEGETAGSSSLSPERGDIGDSSLNDDGASSSQTAYDDEFNQSTKVREEMYRMEKNRMRSPSEGKANLDRYRVASSRIFSLIDETLADKLGRSNYILERASIDELFIDVTAFCYQSTKPGNDEGSDSKGEETKNTKITSAMQQFLSDCDANNAQSLKETVLCHEATVAASGEKDDDTGRALNLGCHVARTVRRVVLETLGFTLSAGISTSKLVSKLAASHGKPNGQAAVFPSAMGEVMDETQLRKARLLGGKLGKKVQSLLPENETTLGSIARLLPLECLEKALGEESGRWVFDACRGIDAEEVRATLKVLAKSITAFKSFSKVSYPELDKWTTLLARDVMKRVENDTLRNQRIPRAITVGYTMVPGGAWIGRTFRLPFPADKELNARAQRLVDNTRKILTDRGHSSLIRIGYSAIDFIDRPKVGIDSFFSKGKGKTQSSSATKLLTGGNTDEKKCDQIDSGGIESFFSTKRAPASKSSSTASPQPSGSDGKSSSLHGHTPPSKLNEKKHSALMNGKQKADGTNLHRWLAKNDNTNSEVPDSIDKSTKMTDEEIARQLQNTYDVEARAQRGQDALADKDMALARQLQSSYNREHEVLAQVERFTGKKRKMTPRNKSKIDFFVKK